MGSYPIVVNNDLIQTEKQELGLNFSILNSCFI